MIINRASGLLTLTAALLCFGTSGAGTRPMVEQASAPEVMFGAPEEYDSLLTLITGGGESSVYELLELADTPWALQFEVVRRALELIGDPARIIILENLRPGKLGDAETVRHLVLLEKIGRVGDEAALVVYLKSGNGIRKVTALRCLVSFGDPESSLELALPLLRSGDERVRLAAVWAIYELCSKYKLKEKEAGRIAEIVRPLLDDLVLQIRLTAAECLQALGA